MELGALITEAARASIARRKDPVWVFDVDEECIAFGNAAACEFWRAADVEALVTRDYTSDMSSATRSRLAATRDAVERGEVVYQQWTFYPASQSPKTVELRAERIELSDARVGLLYSIERAGQTGKDALRGVEALRHTTVLITLFDGDGTHALFRNPAALESDGGEPPRRGLFVSRFVDEEEGQRTLEAVRAGQTVSLETRRRTRNGPRWHGMDARMTVDPVTGHPAILVNEKDIHEAKEAEAGLQEAREELEHRVLLRTTELAASRDFVTTVLDTLDALVIVAGSDDHILWMNRMATQQLGPGLLEQPLTSVEGLPRSDGPNEMRLSTERGERVFHWTVTKLEPPSRRTVMTGVDVTEERALQLQMQANDRLTSLGTLAAGIAHELNNPFTVIRANLEVLRDELEERGLTESLGSAVNDSLAGTDRAARIVADLRAYTRVEEEPRPVDLRRLVESAVGLSAGPLRDLTVEVHVPKGLGVLGVEGPLTQVLLNLLMNAAHSIGGPPGHVRVSARREEDGPEPRVCITVEDDGPGIDTEMARRVFDPFFTTKPVGEGTGLGLYVCRRIVKGHGGEIQFDTAVGSGARVLVRLPVGEPGAPRRPSRLPAPAKESRRVLVVDDDPTVRRAIKRLLRAHVVDLARSGEEALTLLRGKRYAMVLCDMMMPGMSGDELFETVRSEDPSAAARFVFMSGGLPYRSAIGEFFESVPNRFLQKPVDRRALNAALSELGAAEDPD